MKKFLSILTASAILSLSVSASASCNFGIINIVPKSVDGSCVKESIVQNICDSFGINIDAKNGITVGGKDSSDCKKDNSCTEDTAKNENCESVNKTADTQSSCEKNNAITNSECKNDNSCDNTAEIKEESQCKTDTDCTVQKNCADNTAKNSCNTASDTVSKTTVSVKFNKTEFLRALLEKILPKKVVTSTEKDKPSAPSLPAKPEKNENPKEPEKEPVQDKPSADTDKPTPSENTTENKQENNAPSNSAENNIGDFEAEVLALVNAERSKYGLSALTYSEELEAVAIRHSRDMAQNGFFNHTNLSGQSPFDRIKAAGISYRFAAENIAAGQKTPKEVVNAWMNSSGHRQNILNSSAKKMGLGVYTGGSYGIYWTQLFIG